MTDNTKQASVKLDDIEPNKDVKGGFTRTKTSDSTTTTTTTSPTKTTLSKTR